MQGYYVGCWKVLMHRRHWPFHFGNHTENHRMSSSSSKLILVWAFAVIQEWSQVETQWSWSSLKLHLPWPEQGWLSLWEWPVWWSSSMNLQLTWAHQARVIITLRMITMMIIICTWHDRSKGADPRLRNVCYKGRTVVSGAQHSSFPQCVRLAQPKIHEPHCWGRNIQHIWPKLYIKFPFWFLVLFGTSTPGET